MPTVELDYDELRDLAEVDHDDDRLQRDLFELGLEYEGETEDGLARLELESDRLDRLSVEGIARSLRYQYGTDRGVYEPTVNDPVWTVEVEDVPDQRPYVTAAVVRGLDLDERTLESIIQLQEKLHATMGRKRAKGAIGVHDLTMLKGERLDTESGLDDAGAGAGAGPGSGSGPGGGVAADADPDAGPADPDAGGRRPTRSITYTGIDPDGDRFVPLDADDEMTPAEVIDDHPIGTTYADLVADYDRMPAIYDRIGLFSFPPVINGRRTEVSTDSRDLLVEMTGTDQWTIDRMLAIVCYALDARGGRIEAVEVDYGDRRLERPDLSTDHKTVAHDRVESTLGIDLDPPEVVDLAERAGLDAHRRSPGSDAGGDSDADEAGGADSGRDGDAGAGAGGTGEATTADPAVEETDLVYDVAVPAYRVDVRHPDDVVDDVGRAYGFNELEPRYPDVSTIGGRHERSRLADAVRGTLVGLGFEDTLNFHLIGREANFDRMRLEADPDPELDPDDADRVVGRGPAPTIASPYSADYEVVRTWALPSLMQVLSNNTHRSYPQDLAEVGFAARVDPAEETGVAERRTVAAVLARPDASYEDAKARLSALARNFGADLETPPADHPSFLDGRTAAVVLDGGRAGVLGELHPQVIVDHDLELPVVGFEFRLDALSR